jgi:hypothetical protein
VNTHNVVILHIMFSGCIIVFQTDTVEEESQGVRLEAEVLLYIVVISACVRDERRAMVGSVWNAECGGE